MNPEQIQQFKEFYNTYFYYIILGQLIFGLLAGAVPLILGIKKGKRNLGIVGFIACAVIGAVSPLLCVIVAVIFSIVIVVKSKAKVSPDSSGLADRGSSV